VIGCATLQAFACAGEGGPSATEPGTAASGALCPACVALGGETGDFPGGGMRGPEHCPQQRRVEADAGLVLPSGLSVQAAVDLVQREIELPATWSKTESDIAAAYGRRVSGFSEHTAVRLQVQVTAVTKLEFVEDEPSQPSGEIDYLPLDQYPPEVQAACDGLELTANVSMSAGDGSLAGTFEGVVVHVSSALEATIEAKGDISQFIGTLQLAAHEEDALGAYLYLAFNADRVRGELAPFVELASTWVGYENGPHRLSYQPLELRWPGTDACNYYSFPFTGQDARERAARVVDAFNENNTYTAVYLDPAQGPGLRFDDDGILHSPAIVGRTEMTVEASSPDFLCEGRLYPDLYREFDLPTRFFSSDGRYDLSVPLHVDAGTSGVFQAGPLPSHELHRQFGIGPWDFGDFPCATLRIEYSTPSLDEFSKLIMVSRDGCAGGSSVISGGGMESLAFGGD
jgi:hypothetical protein